MHKLEKSVYFFTVIILFVMIMFEYTYSAPAHFFEQFQSAIITTDRVDASTEKELLIELSNKYKLNILVSDRQIERKEQYNVYSTIPISMPNFPQIYTSMENYGFINLESSILTNTEVFFEKDTGLDQLIDDLEINGIDVETQEQDVELYTLSKMTIILLVLMLILNVSLILIRYNSKLKEYSINVLEGISVIKLIIKETINIILQVSSITLILIFILFVFLRPESYIYIWLIKLVKYYIIMIITVKLSTMFLYKAEDIRDYLKGYNRNKNILNFLLCLKVVTFIYLLIIIPLGFRTIGYINNLSTQIEKYSKYDDIIISKIYSGNMSNSIDEEAIIKSESDYYINTVDAFDGTIYSITDSESAINYNALDYIDILDKNNNKIKEEDLSKDKVTVLVPTSKVNSIPSNGDYEVVEIADNQQFLSLDLYNLNKSQMVTPSEIRYYPRNLKNIENTDLGVAISQSGYFLNVPGENKFNTIKPYIEKSNAQGMIISAPSITSNMEESLGTQIEKTIADFIILIICLITVITIIIFTITTYIKIYSKNIVINMLEGFSISQNLKLIYRFLLFEACVVLLFVFAGKILVSIAIIGVLIQILVINLISKLLLRKNLTEYMKGNQ